MSSLPERGKVGRWEKVVVLLWVLVALGIAARLLFASDPMRNNVYLKVFAPAGEAFWARADLFTEGSGFRYPPLCAALFWPFGAAGPVLGSILWRFFNMVVLFAGLRACTKSALPVAMASGERALLFGLTLLIGIGGFNNGQANALLLGCLLLATAGAFSGRTTGPAGNVAVATTVKVYPLVFGFVLATLRPRMWWKLALAVFAIVALPYLLAPADYVSSQYGQLIGNLSHEDRTGDLANAYRDLRLVTAAVGAPMPHWLFVGLQALGGISIVAGARRLDHRATPTAAFSFACGGTLVWMLLLGPSTEKVTYQLLAVPLAWQIVLAYRAGSRGRQLALIVAVLLALADVFPVHVSRALQGAHPWLRCFSPWAALLVAGDLLVTAVMTRDSPARPS